MTGPNGGSLISDEKLRQLYAAMVDQRLRVEHAPRLRPVDDGALGQEALITGWVIDLRPGDTLVSRARRPAQFAALIVKAVARKRKKKGNVVVVFTTVATTELLCWHETLKQAAKRRLPIIFVVENNPWVLRSQALQGESVAETARGYGLPAITVDGNDVVAVYRVACESLERVRDGAGPVLVEGRTYRAAGQRATRDPLLHMKRYLKAKGLFPSK